MGGKVAWRLRGCNKFLAKGAFYRSYGRAPIKTDWKRMRAALFFVVALITLAASAAVQQDAASIIQRSVAANALDWQAAPDYDYFERDQQPDGGTKTYEDLMISGSPYQRLVAVNGKPLPLALEAEEQQKLEAMTRQRRQRIGVGPRRTHRQVRERPEARSVANGPADKGHGFYAGRRAEAPRL